MSSTPVTPNPMSETSGIAGGAQQYADYLRAQIANQSNTTGLTQMGPQMNPQAPPQRQLQQPGPQTNNTYGPGQKGAHQRESMQNLAKSAQGIANKFAQYEEQKKQRQYQQVVGRFMGATQGVQQAQAQAQQGQQLIQQASQRLKENPQDAEARQMAQQGQQMVQQAQGALKQNQTILNDMANDSKQHKVITKAFGIDDKNADSPERAAAMQVMKSKMGVGQGAAGIMSQLPQTQQLSPQAQAQQQARQAGVVGAPATQGQLIAAQGKIIDTGQKEAGKDQRAQAKDQLTAALNGQKYEDGKLVPMTSEEISKNPVLSSKLSVQQASVNLKQAQEELAQARARGIPEQMKIAEAKLSLAQGGLMMRKKEFGIKVQEEERKQLETANKFGTSTLTTPEGGSVEIPGGRPLQSWAQQTVVQSKDRLGQVDALLQKLETMKDNNTPGYLAKDRLAYAMGMGGENGELASEISNIELQRVVNASAILKGSSRAWPALSAAMLHTPNAWTDSPKLMYQKLQTIQKNLQDIQTDAIQYGQKNQPSGEMQPHVPRGTHSDKAVDDFLMNLK